MSGEWTEPLVMPDKDVGTVSTRRSPHRAPDRGRRFNPHAILEVAPGCDPSELRRAYRRSLQVAHPDHGGTRAALEAVRDAYDELRAAAGPRPDVAWPVTPVTGGTADPRTDPAVSAVEVAAGTSVEPAPPAPAPALAAVTPAPTPVSPAPTPPSPTPAAPAPVTVRAAYATADGLGAPAEEVTRSVSAARPPTGRRRRPTGGAGFARVLADAISRPQRPQVRLVG